MNAFPNAPPFFHSLSPPPQQQQRHPWQQQEARRKLNSTITTTSAEPQPLAMPFCSQTNHVLALSTKPPNSSRNSNSPHHERPPKKKLCLSLSVSLCLLERRRAIGEGKRRCKTQKTQKQKVQNLWPKKEKNQKRGRDREHQGTKLGATCARLFTANETRSVGGIQKMKRNRMQRERKLERDDETLATVLASSESQAGAFRRSVSGKGREEGEGNKGRNLGRKIWWRSRGERQRQRQRQSFTVWTTLLVFIFLYPAQSALDCPYLLTYDGNETRITCFFFFSFFFFF